MSKSGFNIGWSSVTITPAGGSAVVILNITEVDFIRSSTKKSFYGDLAVFAKIINNKEKKRGVKISTANVEALQAIPEDTPCTIVAVHNDAKNGTGAGAITCTLINAICGDNPYKGPANNYAMGEITFEAFSADGVTDPFSYAIA